MMKIGKNLAAASSSSLSSLSLSSSSSTSSLLLLVLLLVGFVDESFAFFPIQPQSLLVVPVDSSSSKLCRGRQTCFASEIEENSETTNDKPTSSSSSSSTVTLNLLGKAAVESKPATKIPRDEMFAFFQKNENYLYASDDVQDIEVVTPELVELWRDECVKTGARMPQIENGDSIKQVKTSAIKLPGLTLTSTTMIGTKLLNLETEEYPIYEFTLICDTLSAAGLPPVVWVFNKLTGNDNSNNDDDNNSNDGNIEKESSTFVKKGNSSSSSLTRVFVRANNNNNDEITFCADSKLIVTVNFPAALLKILPTNKEKAEASGAASISKSLVKTITKALEQFRAAYDEA